MTPLPPSEGRRVLTRDDLRLAGRGHDHGDRRVRTGSWRRAAPSTYVTAEVDLELVERIQAALEHAGSDAVVTGWAACVLLRLP